nr:reverse transcriptase domain-containing protein [Tanacetum cinerariifolium]
MLGEHNITYRPRTSVKGQILADFLVENPDDAPPEASVIETPQEQWTLFMDGSSCVDGSGVGLILTSPKGTKFTYTLRFQFTASNNEAKYEALIAGLRIAGQMGVRNVYSQMVPTTTSLTGFRRETIWPLEQLRLLVTIGDAKHYKKAWMNFMIVRSPSSYNGIIRRHGIREIQAVPSTAHRILKFPVNGGIVTIRSTILMPIECATIATTPKDPAKKAEARHKSFKVAIHPDFLDQEITIGGADQSKRKTSERRSDFRNQPKDGRGSNKFTPLTKTPKEIFAAESRKFKLPPPMVIPIEKSSSNKFCEFHNDKGHNTNECVQLRKHIEELASAGKLSHFIKEIRQDRNQQKTGKKNAPVKDKAATIYDTTVIEAKDVATISGNQVKKFVWDNIVCRFGLPGEIVTVKHSQSNRLVERENMSLGEGIKARLGGRNKNWMEELPYVLWAHRMMIKSSNNDTSFSLTYRTEAVIPAEIRMPTYRTAVVDAVHNDEELQLNLDLLEERRERATIHEAKTKLKMTKYYNAIRGVTFRPGDFVYRSNDASHAVDGGKLGPKWEGPYEVTKALGDGAYKLRSTDGTVLSRTWNIANLKKYYL